MSNVDTYVLLIVCHIFLLLLFSKSFFAEFFSGRSFCWSNCNVVHSIGLEWTINLNNNTLLHETKMAVILAQQFTMHSKCNLICIFSFGCHQHHFLFFFVFNLCLLVCLLTEELSLQINQKPKQQKPVNTTLPVSGIVYICIQQNRNMRWIIYSLLTCSLKLVIVLRAHTFFSSLGFVYGINIYGCNIHSLFSILICCWNSNSPTEHS